ncbi:MAG: hypothetical protein ACUVXI_14120 [bacterium]
MRIAKAILSLFLFFSFLAGLTWGQGSQQQGEEKPTARFEVFEEQFSYGLSNFNGRGFSSSFSLRTEDTLYIMANQYNVFSPKITLIYYWPITRKYLAAWNTLNVDMDGDLEILQDGKVIQTLKKRNYVFNYSQGYYAEEAEVVLDEAADAKHKEYKDAVDAYYNALQKYYEAQTQYQKDLDVFFKKIRERDEKKLTPEEYPIEVPKEPEPPKPPTFYVTEPRKAYVVNLNDGVYQIRVRAPDGTILEGSEKNLVAFSKRRGGGVGFEIIPEERWTRRETSSDPSEIIYLDGRNILYLRPFFQDEFNDLYYAKLEDPQNEGRIEKWRWVNIKQMENGTLQLMRGNEVVQEIKEKPYYVKQKPGAELGYTIIDFDPNDPAQGSPSFVGYKLDLDLSGDDYWIRFLDKDGNIIKGSERRILPVKKGNTNVLYTLSLIPLIAYLGVFAWRGRLK